MTQAHALASKPMRTPFYEEQEIHEIANELEARIRANFEKDLATARQQMIDAMMKDRSQESGYMQVHISLEGAYDHKRDIVWVKGEEETCKCCGEPIEEESASAPAPAPAPASAPAPTCTFPDFTYKQAPLAPTRKSARLSAKKYEHVSELVGGKSVHTEWMNTVKTLMANTMRPVIQGDSNSYEFMNGKYDAMAKLFTFLRNSPHTQVMVNNYNGFNAILKHKAAELIAQTANIRVHMKSGCSCFSLTTEQRAQIETKMDALISECGFHAL